MRMLVTGASGFVGRALVARLLADGHAVAALLRPDSPPPADDARLECHRHDGSTAGIRAAVAAAAPQRVFHLASFASSTHRPADVEALIAGNVLYPTQLCEALAAAGVTGLVNVGSAWQHRGGAAYDPVCLYAATKQAAEAVFHHYAAAHGLRAVTVKFFHVYGPHDPRRRLVAQLVAALRSGHALAMSGGEQCIDLLHLDDACAALVRAGELSATLPAGPPRAYAASSGRWLTVRELVALLGRLAGRAPPVRWGVLPYKPREIFAPIATGEPLPGWAPAVALETGLAALLADGDATGGPA